MPDAMTTSLLPLLAANEAEVLKDWQQQLRANVGFAGERLREGELQSQCMRFVRALRDGLEAGAATTDAAGFAELRDLLTELSASRAIQGFSPRETASFVFSLKQPLMDALRRRAGNEAAVALEAGLAAAQLLDGLALFTMEAYQRTR